MNRTFLRGAVIVLIAALVFAACGGGKEAPASDFEYSSDGQGVTITGYKGNGGKVIIPATIDGKPVVEIGEKAFLQNRKIRQITVPESVTKIG